MTSPQISVVLPVYNGAQYIEVALRSLLAQADEFEIIVSDDCSSDNTTEIVRSLHSSRIKLLINKERGGQFVNFNRALRVAAGQYIQLFSHDDVAHSGFLRSQIDALERHSSVGLMYASCRVIDGQGLMTAINDDSGTPELIDLDCYIEISSRHGSLPPSVSCVMLKKSVLDLIGLFDERFAVAGDLEFYNRVAENFSLARNRRLLLDVRAHRGSVTSSGTTPISFMREEVAVLPFYRRHLGERAYREMIWIRSRGRGADHAKYILRTCLTGEFKRCVTAYRALSQVHNVPLCLAIAVLQKGGSILGARNRGN